MAAKKYLYHIEDGQFSFDEYSDELLGVEGEIIQLASDDSSYKHDVYILFVEEHYVECIGNIERSFPKSQDEHDILKQQVIELRADYSTRI